MKMQKRKYCAGMIIVIGMVLSWTSVPAAPIELNLSLIIPKVHNRYVHVIDPWVKMIQERTKGQVKINPYFSNTLAPTPEIYDTTVSGLADISEGVSYGTPGRFPLTETIMLPEIGLRSSLSCSRALWQLYKTFPEVKAEYSNVKMLWLHASPPLKLITKRKPVRTLGDLKGLKIWITGATPVRTAKALGFTPVTMAPGDVYVALERGPIDGAAADNELVISRRFLEVSKYFIDIDLTQVAFFVLMNQKSWNNLPREIQKVFDEATGDWAVDFSGRIRDQQEKAAEKVARASGMEYITISAEEKNRIRTILGSVKDDYAAELETKKLPGKKVLEELMKIAEKSVE